jgi:hypothetical protein
MARPKKTPDMKIAELQDSLTYVQGKHDEAQQRWKTAAQRCAELERMLNAEKIKVQTLTEELAGREKGTL